MSEQLKITKFEHACISIRSEHAAIAIDPGSFTSERSIKMLGGVDAVLVTHRHPDHFNVDVLKRIGAPVFGPKEIVDLIIGNDVNGLRTVVLDPLVGNTAEIAGFVVSSLTVDHGPALSQPIENTGFVVAYGEKKVLFTGDVAGPQQAIAGEFDAIVIPTEGGGFVFEPAEAAEFLRLIGHSGVSIAVHSDDLAEKRKEFVELVTGFSRGVAPELWTSVEI